MVEYLDVRSQFPPPLTVNYAPNMADKSEKCLIHYDTIFTTDKLTALSENALKTLIECKTIRESLGGENGHETQCRNIPEKANGKDYFFHRECYQKFTYAKALLKRKLNKDDEMGGSSNKAHRSTRATSSIHETANPKQLFPDICMICKKKTLKVNQKCQPLTKIVTKTAEKALIDAASLKDDTEMLLEITGVDLIAKEFQKHEKCYRNYTRNKKEEKLQDETLDENVAHGNYDAVLSVVRDNILERQQCLSMETLQTVYGVGVGSRQSRHKLKCRLQKTFGDNLIFLSHEYHSPGVVISKECMQTQTLSKTLQFSNKNIVKKSALALRDVALKFIDDMAADNCWPPTVESLNEKASKIPELLKLFYVHLLSKPELHHDVSERVNRLANSFSQDVVSAISMGKFISAKHASVGLGLHSVTGQKFPITVLARLGHSITYDQVNQIETAQAELVQKFQSLNLNLPIQPATEDCRVCIPLLNIFLFICDIFIQ